MSIVPILFQQILYRRPAMGVVNRIWRQSFVRLPPLRPFWQPSWMYIAVPEDGRRVAVATS